mgnify:CR=1 FL=1
MTRAVRNRVLPKESTTKPLIINGDMAIAQRATSATTVGNGNSGYNTCDRWRFSELGSPSGEFTISQDTSVPTGYGFKSSLKFDVTTADSGMASGDLFRLEHRTEAQDCRPLNYGTSLAEATTLAFWVKSNKTGTYSFHIRQNDDQRGLTKSYTISSADTWEKKIINIPADTTGVIENDTGIGLMLYWNLATGTDFTGTTQETYAANADGFVAQGQAINLLDSTDNEWFITGVQLEIGDFNADTMPPFQFEDVGTSLARCQRYFTKTLGAYESSSGGSGSKRVHWQFKQTMRATPTIVEAGTTKSGVQLLNADTYGINRSGDNAATLGSGTTAEAEL